MPERKLPAYNFDRLAGIYDVLLQITSGRLIARSRRALLSHLSPGRHALIAGEGTGEFLANLAVLGIFQHITCVDLSRKMLQRAERRLRKLRKIRGKNAQNATASFVEFVQMDLRREVPVAPGSVDLVVTNYFLDVFPEDELEVVMNRLDNSLAAGGVWYFSDFVNRPRWKFLRLIFAVGVRMLYFVFGWTTGMVNTRLPEYDDHFARLGYTLEAERSLFGGLLACRLYRKP